MNVRAERRRGVSLGNVYPLFLALLCRFRRDRLHRLARAEDAVVRATVLREAAFLHGELALPPAAVENEQHANQAYVTKELGLSMTKPLTDALEMGGGPRRIPPARLATTTVLLKPIILNSPFSRPTMIVWGLRFLQLRPTSTAGTRRPS